MTAKTEMKNETMNNYVHKLDNQQDINFWEKTKMLEISK